MEAFAAIVLSIWNKEQNATDKNWSKINQGFSNNYFMSQYKHHQPTITIVISIQVGLTPYLERKVALQHAQLPRAWLG